MSIAGLLLNNALRVLTALLRDEADSVRLLVFHSFILLIH